MNSKPSYFEGVGLALLISIVGSVIFFGLASLFSGGLVFRLLINILSLSYVIYLLVRSTEKTGRVSLFAIWALLMILNTILADSLLLYLGLHILAIWLIRSLYYYNSLFSSLSDLLLTVFSLTAAIFAWQTSNSLLLSLWTFFLLQALFTFIPTRFFSNKKDRTITTNRTSQFEHAYRSAQLALNKLSTFDQTNRRTS